MTIKYWNSTSNSDAGVAGNWSGGSLPATGDVVIRPASTSSITAGLTALSSATLAGFFVELGYAGQIGTPSAYLSISLSSGSPFSFAGAGQAYIDLGSSAVGPVITNTFANQPGAIGLYLLGSELTTLSVRKGSVGVAARGGETATVATVDCDWSGNQASDSYVLLGSGVTVTTVNQTGGTCVINCSVTTIHADAGTLYLFGSGTVSTLNNNGATAYPNSTGTIGTLNADAGTTDFTRSRDARTLTTLASAGRDATVVYDPGVLAVTNRLNPSVPVQISVKQA